MGFDSPHQQFKPTIKIIGCLCMNSENQKTIIKIFGACLTITLIGVIIMAIRGTPLEIITIFTGIFTAIFTALATFLQGKNMTEKQNETLEQYYRDKAKDDQVTIGSIAFDTEDEMTEYLKNHIEDMITEADTVERDGEGDVQ